MAIAHIWSAPPPMDVGAPMPHLKAHDDRLLVAYVCANPAFPGWDSGSEINHPGFDAYSAVLEFSGLKDFSFGPPNDEKLREHPLYLLGVRSYCFYEVTDIGRSGIRRWVIAFHDETLGVTARSATVLKARVEGEDTKAIINAIT